MTNSKTSKKISKKENKFCEYYTETGDIKESAVRAGYKNNPEKTGIELLYTEKISNKIKKLYEIKKKNLIYQTIVGYEKLAFGNISDCIKLLFCENLNFNDLKKMNLFNISEIKKPKDGSMEIKFFDRMRALEKLEQIDNLKNSEKEPFYYALENSIKNFESTGE